MLFASIALLCIGIMPTTLAATTSDAHGTHGAHDAASLRATYAALAPKLKDNQFGRPLVLDSTEAAGNLEGDIFAVLAHPFGTVDAAFNGPAHWCDMLILHLNTKYCRTTNENGRDRLTVAVGKKHDQPLEDAYRVKFDFTVVAATPDYLDVVLGAKDGPMGTSDYRILMEAVALPNGRTFLHLTYSYGYGVAARVAMKAYLATAGSGKVGFTRAGDDGAYIGGVRGVVERNTMRYYLAIEAYLASMAAPAGERLDRRLHAWFDATERYARQLHEVERGEYVEMKRAEYQRQQASR